MLFNSLEFFFFFILVYPLYLLLKHQWQNRLLVVSSCIFYAAWNWKFLGVMFFSISVDYLCARAMHSSPNAQRRKLLLFLSIFVNLTILVIFKYFNFFTSNIDGLFKFFHLDWPSAAYAFKIILPLGISFYTFEAISYTVDVYRSTVEPARKYWDYVLFVIYFPHLIAGPIMRAKSFLPQITNPRIISAVNFYEGSHLFFWGLFEKMFVADNMAKIVNPIFAPEHVQAGVAVLLGLYAFAFQIYCDFDGYSNMARGLGKMMGFDITINFKFPYFSNNPREYWQRWHISLSSWLKDYLYIPLGGNRFGQPRMYLAILITMLLGGLWHGAAWNFVIWGLYQALLILVYRQLNMDVLPKMAKGVIFFHLIVLGWLFFRAQSFHQIHVMLQALFLDFKLQDVDLLLWIKFGLFVLPFLVIQYWQYKTNDFLIITKQHWFLKSAIYAFLAYLVLGWGVLKAEEFIYFQF
jgi:alginate O-acetyltransferase complex protein AlgI